MSRTSKAARVPTCAVLAIVIAIPLLDAAEQPVEVIASTPETLAFARYVKALQEPDPFAVRGMFEFSVSATLAELYKTAALITVRKTGVDGDRLSAYAVGDGTVLAEVIARCLDLKAELYKMPVNTIAITPENYKSRFAGEVNTGAGHAFRYKIVPRRPDGVPITGHLWLDSRTGREVMLVGRLKRAPSIDGPVSVVRETKLGDDGAPIARITHLTFSVAGLGRAEVEYAEYLSPSAAVLPPLPAQTLAPEQSN